MNIISHRGYLAGGHSSEENRVDVLERAVAQGFEVEFDVNLALSKDRLVLSHERTDWTPDRDAASFLSTPHIGERHALNIKSLLVLSPATEILRRTGTVENYFLFDFELLWPDVAEVRFLMHSLTENGFHVAYRLSEREPYLEVYLRDESVKTVWLDEFEQFWVKREHVERLKASGKQVFFVSPELHGTTEESTIKQRWSDVLHFGVDGICTDFPVQLRDFAR